MYEYDHARPGKATSPNAHEEPNRDRRPPENPSGQDRPKPGGPHFPVPEHPDPEPEKSGAR